MKMNVPRISSLAAFCLILLMSAPAWSDNKPAPIRALEQQGMTIEDAFAAPGGLTGYAASYQGQPMAVYLLPDGKYAIIGTMVNANGQDVSAKPLEKLVAGPQNEKAWSRVQDATWVADGASEAPQVVYMFMDANCPYCHQFWRNARPWVKAGKVQIREILVALLKPSSLPKAAAILSSGNPVSALRHAEQNYAKGGVEPMGKPPAGIVRKIGDNTELMRSLGYFATPTLLYRNADGHVQVKQGVPQTQQAMAEVMGSPKP